MSRHIVSVGDYMKLPESIGYNPRWVEVDEDPVKHKITVTVHRKFWHKIFMDRNKLYNKLNAEYQYRRPAIVKVKLILK